MIEIEHLASCVQVLEIINEAHRQVIKEKDASLALLSDNLQNREYENVVLQHKRMSIRSSYKNVKTTSPILKYVMVFMQEILARTTLTSLYGNIQHLPKINIMTCYVIL